MKLERVSVLRLEVTMLTLLGPTLTSRSGTVVTDLGR